MNQTVLGEQRLDKTAKHQEEVKKTCLDYNPETNISLDTIQTSQKNNTSEKKKNGT